MESYVLIHLVPGPLQSKPFEIVSLVNSDICMLGHRDRTSYEGCLIRAQGSIESLRIP
jgi:hypothetical protein